MNNIAIKVQNLTKIYHLYNNPQDRLKEALHPFKKVYHHDFYAMNDVSFTIKKGETVGIIGKNGAGKSTLLKMITGVLTPTSGSIEVTGKIASLLELGAGFNPEMSGIENIYLNGTLMGFTKKEMESKIDSILEFADIGEFINQPVKMYSSGMFARLAFSVAINIDAEVLIVDEVLSVGDMRFQQKSLRKMKSMQESGVTILFVGHDMAAINHFCSKVIWINEGTIIEQGDTETISKNYISFMSYGSIPNDKQENMTLSNNDIPSKTHDIMWTESIGYESFGEYGAVIEAVALCDLNDTTITDLFSEQKVKFYIKFNAKKTLYSVALGLVLKDRLGNNIFSLNSYMYDNPIDVIESNHTYVSTFEFNFPYLAKGEYLISVALSEGTQENHIQHHWIHDIYQINYLSKEKTNEVAALLALSKDEVKTTYERI